MTSGGPENEETRLETHDRTGFATTHIETGPRGGPAGAPSTGGSFPRTLGAIDPWYSPFEGAPGAATTPRSLDRFKVGVRLREEAGRIVHEAEEVALDRKVEIHFPSPPAAPGHLDRVRRLHERIRGPGVPTVLDSGVDPSGRAYLVMASVPPLSLRDRLAAIPRAHGGAAARSEILEDTLRAARAIARVHEAGAAHLALDAESIRLGPHGEVVVTGWGSRDADAGEVHGAAGDVSSLGEILEWIATGRRGRPREGDRPLRALPGVPPEVLSIARRAEKLSSAYPTATPLVLDLDLAMAGEAIAGVPSPLSRRTLRIVRRHPYVAALSLLWAVAAIFVGLGLALVLDRARERERSRVAEVDRLARIAAEGDLDQARELLPALSSALLDHENAAAQIREIHERRTRPGSWGPAKEDPSESDPRTALAASAQASARILAEIESILERPLATPELASEALETAWEAICQASEAHARHAVFEEDRTLSTRTLLAARRTREAKEVLIEVAESRDLDPDELEALHLSVPAHWRPLLSDLAGLARMLAIAGAAGEGRWTRLLERLDATGRIRIGEMPRGTGATLAEVASDGATFEFIDRVAVTSGQELVRPMGEYVLILSEGPREVRHVFELGRSDLHDVTPEWPREQPPGDFVYVPAGRFRAGRYDAYRVESVDTGYFVGKKEVTLGAYLEFVRALGPMSDETLGRILPRDETGLLVGADLVPVEGYLLDMPVAGVRHEATTRYCDWLSRESPGRWVYSIPSEAEWEYAARGALGRTYPWGDSWPPGPGWLDRNRPARLPMGRAASRPEDRSVFGLFDMAASLGELTSTEIRHRVLATRGANDLDVDPLPPLTTKRPQGEAGFKGTVGFRVICRRPDGR